LGDTSIGTGLIGITGCAGGSCCGGSTGGGGTSTGMDRLLFAVSNFLIIHVFKIIRVF
jgi:hypothetical protein